MDDKRAAELFDQAVEIPPDQRAAWLAMVCAGDASLRAELERLLYADAHAGGFLDTPVGAGGVPTDVPGGFGPWRVLHSLGTGGMGEVWLAERSDGEFEQRAAIKQVAYPTPGLLQRFRQERQILAHLEHPGIARLIDGGVDEAGVPYLVMEYVDGVPITEYARTRALDVRTSLRLFLRACDAVQYAHQNLVVHRDLKPSNILVTADGTPKLLDFGIAKVLATTDEATATRTATRMLTPGYAAPEQFSGGPITTATDVYALGVVLYELLAGTRPQRRAVVDDTGPASTDGVDTQPPSAVLDRTRTDFTSRRRALRGDLDRIVLTAMADEPSRRYSSAETLANDIRNHLDGRAISIRRDSTWYRFRKFAGRNRYALGAAVVIVLVSVAAAGVSIRQARIARSQTARAEASRKFLVDTFNAVDPEQSKGQPLTAHKLLEAGERQLSDRLRDTPAIRTDITALLGALYRSIGDYDRARVLLQRAVREGNAGSVPAEVRARSLMELADLQIDKHEYEAAFDNASKALALAEGAGTAGIKEASGARQQTAAILVYRGDSGIAEPLLREAIARDLANFGERSEAVANDWHFLGIALDELSRYDEATPAFHNAIELLRSVRGGRSSYVSSTLNDQGLMFLHSGRLDEAEAAFHESFDIASALYGADSDNARSIHSNSLRVMELQGRYAEVLPQRQRMLQVLQQGSMRTRPDQFAIAHNFIGIDRRELGQFGEAQEEHHKALAIWNRIHGNDNSSDASSPYTNLGVALALGGDFGASEQALRQSIAIQQQHSAPTSTWLNLARAYLGNTLRLQHRYADALRETERAVNASKAGNEANPNVLRMVAILAEAQLDAGDAAASEATASLDLATSRRALPRGNLRLGEPLFALARADLALGHPDTAEPLLREALAVRSPPYPADDPRVLEVKVALVNALEAQHKGDEARALRGTIEPVLQASKSPYSVDLLARLSTR